MTEQNSEAPDLFDVLQITRDFGLVGEDDTVLTVILAMIRGQLVIMTGPSRSGKDAIVDAAESAFNSRETVYKWPSDDSKTAAFYNRHEINQYPVQRFPDLTSLPDHQESILKAFGEGRDADRVFTDISNEEGDEAETQVLEAPRTVIGFAASDNEKLDLDDYPELRNRGLLLSPDATEEQTDNVQDRKARERAGLVNQQVDPVEKVEIQQYLTNIPVRKWDENPDYRFLNPAAIAVDEQEPIPSMFVEARQDFDRLLEFFETVALYHHEDRMTVPHGGKEAMLVTPTDVWYAMKILGDKMVMSSLNLQDDDLAILELLKDTTAELSKSDIQQKLRSLGFNINDREVYRSLTSMREKGYIREFQGSPNTYSVSDFGAAIDAEVGLDYESLVERTSDVVYEIISDDDAQEYVAQFCEGEGLHAVHPFKGYEVDITEDSSLSEQVEERTDKVAEILEDDPFAGGEEPESDGEAEVTDTASEGEPNQTLEGTL